MIKKKEMLVIVGLFVFFILVFFSKVAVASEKEASGIPIVNQTDFNQAMTSKTNTDYYLANDLDVTIGTNLVVSTNKRIDLNGFQLNFLATGDGNNGGIILKGYQDFTEFKLYDSSPERTGKLYSKFNYNNGWAGGLIYDGAPNSQNQLATDGQNVNLIVTLQDLNVQSEGSFLNTYFSKGVLMKGKVDINVVYQGIRASNITAYGNPNDSNDPDNALVNSSTSYIGGAGAMADGAGAVNFALGFQGIQPPITGINSRMDERIFWVQKNATVMATSAATDTYGNVVANYRTIKIDGTLDIKTNMAPAFRSIASQNGGTTNTQMYLNSGSNTRVEVSSPNASFGVIYTYKMDINIDNPKLYDFIFLGNNGRFFYVYGAGGSSNIYHKNSNTGLWLNTQKGIGNPNKYWKSLDFTVNNLTESGLTVANSSDATFTTSVFNLNSSSRWSNNIFIPGISLDPDIALINNEYQLFNNKKEFSGQIDYFIANELEPDYSDSGILTLTIGSDKYTVNVADSKDSWTFPVDLSKYLNNTKATLTWSDKSYHTASVKLNIRNPLVTISSKATDDVTSISSTTVSGTADPGAYIRLSDTPVTDAVATVFDPKDNTIVSPIPDSENSDISSNYTIKADATGKYSYTLPSNKHFSAGTKIKVFAYLSGNRDSVYQTVIDATPPIGEGKDYHSVKGAAVPDPQSFVQNPTDSNPLKQDFTYAFTEENPVSTIEQMLATAGTYTVKVDLFDEAKNKTTITSMLIVHETGFQFNGEDLSIGTDILPEMTSEEIEAYILKNSNASANKIADGLIIDLTENIVVSDMGGLTSTSKAGTYVITLMVPKENVGGLEDEKKQVTFTVINKFASLTISFVNEIGEEIIPAISMEELIGETVDLTKEQSILDSIDSILQQKYQINERPVDEKAVLINPNGTSVQYKFYGTLSIESAPNTVDFGTSNVGIFPIKVEKATYEAPFIVWDNRAQLKSWTLTATLQQPLTNKADTTKILPGAIQFRKNSSVVESLEVNTAFAITTHTHSKSGSYDVSEQWQTGETGFQLEVPAGSVRKLGEYEATILWQLGDTP